MSYKVTGLRELIRASQKAERETKLATRAALRRVGNIVLVPTRQRIGEMSGRSAAGVKVYVRQRGVSIEQSRRKVNGKHRDWGITQMRRGFLPAFADTREEAVGEFDRAVEQIKLLFERG